MSRHRTLRKLTVTVALIAAALALPVRAWATDITYRTLFSIDGTGTAVTDFLTRPFNPALGTLDRVFVGVSITLHIGVPVPDDGSGGFPHLWTLAVSQDMYGLRGQFFDLDPEARWNFFEFTAAGGVVYPLNYTFGFQLDSFTDQRGFPTPVNSSGIEHPPEVLGQRSNFLPTFLDDYQIEVKFETAFAPFAAFDVEPSPIRLTGSGDYAVTYFYTPTNAPPADAPPTVPEPATLCLCSAGLIGAGIRRWRARRA